MNIHTYTPGPKTLKSRTSNANATTEKLIHWVQQRNLRILLLRVTALLKLKIVLLQAYHCNNWLWQPTYLYLQVPIPSLLVWSEIRTHPLLDCILLLGTWPRDIEEEIWDVHTWTSKMFRRPMLSLPTYPCFPRTAWSPPLQNASVPCSQIFTQPLLLSSSYLPTDMAMEERVLSCKSRPSPSQPLAEAPEFGTLVYWSGA